MRVGVCLTEWAPGAEVYSQQPLWSVGGGGWGIPQGLGGMAVPAQQGAWEDARLPLANPGKLSSDSGKGDHHLRAGWLRWPDPPSIKLS